MLSGLSIRDIVLIEKLDLNFGDELTVLTGETGAGKSILLDSLSLAIGGRSVRALVREGAEQGSVTAAFDLPIDHGACKLLEDEGYDANDGTLILRRQINSDGRSKAWINDSPVTRTMLGRIGELLVEIHGQHDDRGLVDPAAHRSLLDMFADSKKAKKRVTDTWKVVRARRKELEEAEAAIEDARKDEEFLRHATEELAKVGPQEGEETELAEQRASMMHGERMASDLASFQKDMTKNGGPDAVVRGVLRRMERVEPNAQQYLAPIMESLDRAAIELDEAMTMLNRVTRELDFDPVQLEETEERLFELRRLARKHSVTVDALPALLEQFEQRIKALDVGDSHLYALRQANEAAWVNYREAVVALHESRVKAAQRLDKAVNTELPPLKLEKAAFQTKVELQAEETWGASGGDYVEFEVRTNPGTPFGPMTKIASGGETARFILALKVVLGSKSSIPVMVFDEVDRGIGGATADAVGERLARLAGGAQVLVVTHSPQVAARGSHHMKIAKSDNGRVTRTDVAALDTPSRTEEIARMLAGAEITPEARAAAERLIAQG